MQTTSSTHTESSPSVVPRVDHATRTVHLSLADLRRVLAANLHELDGHELDELQAAIGAQRARGVGVRP